ncbi:unnamed protein product [Nesidiocoris tenuis]|uniref:Uncharacterized protein n=1 Tax=Nesidiocoris tenuis TaxID=355587 RepID=A0A6H5GUX9_9HEMI|nr:unnamed protein product [Nesidiocoris tenuis]
MNFQKYESEQKAESAFYRHHVQVNIASIRIGATAAGAGNRTALMAILCRLVEYYCPSPPTVQGIRNWRQERSIRRLE